MAAVRRVLFFGYESSEKGFSLLELSISIVISSMLLTLCISLYINLWMAKHQLDIQQEEEAMCLNIIRVISQDAHAATSVSILYGMLQIVTVDGRTIRYGVTGSHQMLRYYNHGVSVLADGVQQMQVANQQQFISLTIQMDQGLRQSMNICTLSGALAR